MGAITVGRPFTAPHAAPLSRLSDERLAWLVHRGEDDAFATLYERYRVPLARYCRSIVGDPEDARDAQQNAMLAALGALRDRTLTGRVKPWLYRIAHNESVTVLRRRRDHEELDELTPSPRAELQQLEVWELLLSDLRSLPERQRGALLMRELGGLEYEEIGAALGMSPGRARKTVFEARSALTDNAAGRNAGCAEVRLKLSDCDGRVPRGRRVRVHLESCAPCTAFALSLRERRRAYELIPVAPAMPIGGGIVAAAGSVTGGGIAAGGFAIGTGSAGSAIAVKGIAACALCVLAGAGVALTGTHHRGAVERLASRPAIVHARRQPAATGANATVPGGQSTVRHDPRTAPSATHSSGNELVVPAHTAPVAVSAPRRRPPKPHSMPARSTIPTRPTSGTPPANPTSAGATPSPPAGSQPIPATTPVATAASAQQTESQLIVEMIQAALRSVPSMPSMQQSALLALEQQWQAAGSPAAATTTTLASVQSLISTILSGGSGWTGGTGSR